jgi:hypothetical protein
MLACLLTLLNLVFTYTLYCCGNLSPTLSLVFNFILFGLWTTCLGLLASNLQGILTTSCDIDHWGNNTGVMVCRDYKALFAFLVLAFISHLFAVLVDIVAWRKRQNVAEYDAMHGEDIKLHQRGDSAFSVPGNIREHDPRPDADTDTDTDAFGTAGLADHHAVDQPTHPTPYQEHLIGEAHEYYDNVPDVPASANARNRGDPPHYSPLRARTDTQTGYEPYRPHGY